MEDLAAKIKKRGQCVSDGTSRIVTEESFSARNGPSTGRIETCGIAVLNTISWLREKHAANTFVVLAIAL